MLVVVVVNFISNLLLLIHVAKKSSLNLIIYRIALEQCTHTNTHTHAQLAHTDTHTHIYIYIYIYIYIT